MITLQGVRNINGTSVSTHNQTKPLVSMSIRAERCGMNLVDPYLSNIETTLTKKYGTFVKTQNKRSVSEETYVYVESCMSIRA